MGDKTAIHLTIRRDQKAWADANHINLSALVREKLDEEME